MQPDSDRPAPGASDPSVAGLDGREGPLRHADQADLLGAVTGLDQPRLPGANEWPVTAELDLAAPTDEDETPRRDVEAILFVADEPVTVADLAGVTGRTPAQVEALLVDLAADLTANGRGFVLRAVAGGWRLFTHPAAHPRVEAYLRSGTQARLTRAALETLAVIAYRQPVTRQHVSAVRGVSIDGVLRTLLNRGLVHEVGREEGPGQPTLYGTTTRFLEQLGLRSLDQLPPVADYLPEGVDLSQLEETW